MTCGWGRYKDSNKLHLLITLDTTEFKINLPSFISAIITISSSCIYLNLTTACLCSKNNFFNPEKFLVVEMAVTVLPPSYGNSQKQAVIVLLTVSDSKHLASTRACHHMVSPPRDPGGQGFPLKGKAL